MIYLTTYNFETKQPMGPSQPMHVGDLVAASVAMGRAPDITTPRTRIWHMGGGVSVCLSPTCFSRGASATLPTANNQKDS